MSAEEPLLPVGARIPRHWRWHRLDAVCDGIFDCPHSTPTLTDEGPFVVRTQDVRTGVFRTDQAARVSEETYRERIRRAEPRPGDLLFSREGTYFGNAAEVPLGVRVCLGQRMVLIRPIPHTVDSRYLRLWLNSPLIAGHASGFRDGSVAERLNLPTIRAFPVGLPPLAEQKAIASVLGTLDDQIEANRRMNETLEELARTIFKSWFVDFDPVRAKVEGREPVGMDAETAALFPSRLIESHLGYVPEGWQRGTVADLVRLVGGEVRTGPFGTMLKADEYVRDGIPAIAVRDIRTGYVEITRSTPRVPLEVAERLALFRLRPGDILFGRKGAVERFAVMGGAEDGWLMGSDCIRLRVPEVFAEFLARLFQQESHRTWMHQHATGTTMPSLNQGIIERIPLVLPTGPVVQAFATYGSAITARARHARSESDTLAELRDLLLPKLISGELRVPTAEKMVEAAL